MSETIKFGTDGWRASVAEDYSFDNVRCCAQGFASYLLQTGAAGKSIIVGHDQRFRSEHFAAAVAEVMAGNGIRVWLTDRPTPTPVISYSVIAKGGLRRGQHHRQPQPLYRQRLQGARRDGRRDSAGRP